MILRVIEQRQSVREYSGMPVERSKIENCLNAARLAPSASNSQPWRFIVIDEPELRGRVAEKIHDVFLKMNRFTLDAPVLVTLVYEKPDSIVRLGGFLKNKPFYLIDIGIAAEHFCLQAVEEGLGTCMVGWFDERAVKRLVNVPRQARIPLIITLGYPAKAYTRTKIRKSIDEIRAYNRYR